MSEVKAALEDMVTKLDAERAENHRKISEVLASDSEYVAEKVQYYQSEIGRISDVIWHLEEVLKEADRRESAPPTREELEKRRRETALFLAIISGEEETIRNAKQALEDLG